MEIAFFDLEYTSWQGAKARNWGGAGEYREVIEIGALVADSITHSALRTLSTFVRPTINPVLSDYIKGLTGIRQEQVDTAAGFCDALARLLGFLGATPTWVYGVEDLDVLVENCGLTGLDAGGVRRLATRDVSAAFAAAGVDLLTTSTCDLAGLFGVPMSGRAHSALADAQSLATASFVLDDRGVIGAL